MGATCSSNSLNPNCTNPTIQLNSNPIPTVTNPTAAVTNPSAVANLSLTNPTIAANPTTIIPKVEFKKKIDNFTFILLSKQKDDRYNYVIVNIEEIGKTYKYYSSNSELGLWRLCLIRAENNMFYKGTDFNINNSLVKHDYVQNTLIHLELQDFINQNFDKLILLQKNSKNICPIITDDEYNIINNPNRFILENPFLTINTETSCGEIANLDKLNDFSTVFED